MRQTQTARGGTVEPSRSLAIECHGARIGIRLGERRVLPHLLRALPPGSRPIDRGDLDAEFALLARDERDGEGRRLWAIEEEGERVALTSGIHTALDVLEALLHHAVAAHAPRLIFVHAGVVGWRDRAIVLPGESRSGKTTLVTALVRAGATYYSDEFAVLDRCGLVHPYPRRLHIRDDSRSGSSRVVVEALGGTRGADPLTVGLVAFARYQPDAVWQPDSLTAGQAALGLLDHALHVRSRPAAALDAFLGVTAGAILLHGTRGSAAQTAAALLDSVVAGEPARTVPGLGRSSPCPSRSRELTA